MRSAVRSTMATRMHRAGLGAGILAFIIRGLGPCTAHGVRSVRSLPLLIALSVPLRAAEPGAERAAPVAPPAAGQAEAAPADDLPPGVVQKGTLANPKLLRDTSVGVAAAAGTLGILSIEKALPYVTQLPQGEPGSRAWAERWVVFQGTTTATIDIRFQEDGAGGATWTIEVPENAKAAAAAELERYVAVAKEFVQQAQAGNVDRMLALTSPQTIRNSGRRQVKDSYRKYVVPRFKAATVRWNDAPVPATDETGNRGWDVVGDAEGSETFSFFVSVMKEKGKYVVVTLGRRNPDDRPQ